MRRVIGSFASIVLATSLLVTGGNAAIAANPGAPDTPFNDAVAAVGGLNDIGYSVAVDDDGKAVVVGKFSDAGGISGVNGLARFNADGSPDTAFNAAVADSGGLSSDSAVTVHSVVIDDNGKIVVGGNFLNAGGTTGVNRLARFNADGSPDTAFNAVIADSGGLDGLVSGMALNDDGQIVVIGSFNRAGGESNVNKLARFNSDGSPDTAFNANMQSPSGGLNGAGNSVAIDDDGKVVVTGAFWGVTSLPVSEYHLARFNADGSPDNSFNSAVADSGGLNDSGRSVVVDDDGKVVVTGDFTTVAGVSDVNHLARFNADGSPDTAFNAAIADSGGLDNNPGFSLALDDDRRIVVTGNFTRVAGIWDVKGLARFNADGSPDTAFNAAIADSGGLDDTGWSLALDDDGKIVVTGQFLNAGGTSGVNRLARFGGAEPGPFVPSAPTISKVTAGNTKLTVAFTAGANGGSPITNYQYSTNNGSSWSAASPAVTSSPLTISGLKNGTTYQVKIRAVNSIGSGPASNMKQGIPIAPHTTKSAQRLPAGAVPAKVKSRGVTVLNKRGAKTKEGRPVTGHARVKLSHGSGKKCYRLIKGKTRKLSIRTYGKCSFRLQATYTAPGNSKYRAMKKTKTWRIKR